MAPIDGLYQRIHSSPRDECLQTEEFKLWNKINKRWCGRKSKNGVKQKKWNYLAKILSVFASPPKRSKALAWVAGMTLAGNTRVLAMFVLFQVYVSCPKGQASQVACSWTQPSLLCNRGSIRFNVDTSYVLDIPPVMASDLNATELSGIGRQEWTISQEDLRETKILNRAGSIFTLMKKYEYL